MELPCLCAGDDDRAVGLCQVVSRGPGSSDGIADGYPASELPAGRCLIQLIGQGLFTGEEMSDACHIHEDALWSIRFLDANPEAESLTSQGNLYQGLSILSRLNLFYDQAIVGAGKGSSFRDRHANPHAAPAGKPVAVANKVALLSRLG